MIKFLKIFYICCLISGVTFGQNLPKIQPEGLRAPSNVKIDGLLTEWNNTFKADNPANRMLYSIANDDKNVYLVVKMKDARGNYKAINGAIQFTILNSVTNSNNNELLSVAYPYAGNRNEIIFDLSSEGYELKKEKSVLANQKIDSISKVANKLIASSYKEIELLNEKGKLIKVLSLYNEEGIRVASKFNQFMEYTLEMSIPLKMFNAEKSQKFKYKLGLIGTSEPRNGKGGMSFTNLNNLPPDVLYSGYTTNFIAEYFLKK